MSRRKEKKANRNNFHLLYSTQDKKTFFFARWQKEYTSDLVFVTGQEDKYAMQARWEVLNNFSNSKHLPLIITIGLKNTSHPSLTQIEMKFPKSKVRTIQNLYRRKLQPDSHNSRKYLKFTGLTRKSAKLSISRRHRKQFILC